MKLNSQDKRDIAQLLFEYRHACQELKKARELQNKATCLAYRHEQQRNTLLQQLLCYLRKGVINCKDFSAE